MPVVSRGALLAATASLAAGLLADPGAAYADDTSTSLSAAEMSAALKTVGTASAQASAKGWTAAVKVNSGSVSGSEWFAVDAAAGVAFQRYAFGDLRMALYVVAGRGTYASLDDPTSRAVLTMMHRSSVRYVFNADKSVRLDESTEMGVSPATLLANDVDYAGTKTVHDDGSTDYRLSQDGQTVTVHVTAAGVLASATMNGEGTQATLAYTYGPQHLKLPSAAVTISSAALAKGMAYRQMATWVKQVAGQAATDALRAAHHRMMSVSLLRKVAQRDARAVNADNGVTMIRTASVRGGVRVYATNPWTHRTVSYTLTASGRKVTIARR